MKDNKPAPTGIGKMKKTLIVLLGILFLLLMILNIFAPSKKENTKKTLLTANTQEEKLYDSIIEEHLENLKKEGYSIENWRIVIPSDIEKIKNRLQAVELPLKEEEILKNVEIIVNFKKLTIGNNIYYLKSTEECENFITKLNKYNGKQAYKIKDVQEKIEKETSKEILDKKINEAKIAKEKKDAEELAKKKEAEKKALENKKKQQASSSAKKSTTTTTNKSSNTSNKSSNNSTTKSNANKNTSVNGTAIANYAKQFVGNPYVMGGTSLTKGADCSGFTQSVYKHFGISIPRVARDQARYGKAVAFKDLQPGDLVFYSGNGGKSVTHVAMYIGNGKIVHAQTPAKGIGISPVKIMVYMGARRVI